MPYDFIITSGLILCRDIFSGHSPHKKKMDREEFEVRKIGKNFGGGGGILLARR